MTALRERLSVGVAACCAFGGTLGARFVFDDFALFSDPVISSPSGWLGAWGILQTRPLTWFSFWANYQTSGESPLAWHIVNLLLHVGVTLLLLEFLKAVLPAQALLGALVFAVHPAMMEPVAYVFARATLIAAFFSVAALLAWIRGREWLAVALFMAAMLGKEECAAVPVFLLLFEASRRRRISWAPLIAMFAVALVLGLRVVWAAATVPGSQAGSQAGISPFAYFAAEGPVVLRYLRLIAVPWGFSIDPGLTPPSAGIAVASWAALLTLAVLASRRFKDLAAGFWFVGGLILLAPSSSILPAADLAADRRMYLPMLAFSVIVALLFHRAGPKLAALAMIVLLAISIYYCSLWRDPEALWMHAVEQSPANVRARIQLARTVEHSRALVILDAAARLAPEDPRVFSEQGRVLLQLGRAPEALGALGKALALDPNDPKAINNRGAALLALGQKDAARADFQRALAEDPCLFDARLNLARLGVPLAPSNCRLTPQQKSALP